MSVVLFLLGGVFAIYEAVEKLRHPEEIESAYWAFGILITGIILEAFSFRTAIVEAEKVREGRTWWGFIRRSKSPELPVVLLEDLGALIGLVLALIGISLAVATGEPVFDALGTLAIGVLLIVIAVVLAVEMKSLLIGESASHKQLDALHRAVEETPDVLRLIHMRTQHLGPDELLVAAKVEFDHSLNAAGLAAAIDATEVRMREAVPIARVIYLEPDLYVTAET